MHLYLFRTEDYEQAKSICDQNYQCRYDYAMSLNRDMAHVTKNYYDTVTQIRAINQEKGKDERLK